MQIANHTVTYYIDDERLAEHGEPYYPEVPMSINFNLWFIRDQLIAAAEPRRYIEDVDWVYHEVGSVLSPAQVRTKVAALRQAKVAFRDTVPSLNLISPCDF